MALTSFLVKYVNGTSKHISTIVRSLTNTKQYTFNKNTKKTAINKRQCTEHYHTINDFQANVRKWLPIEFYIPVSQEKFKEKSVHVYICKFQFLNLCVYR